jgi:hypothetical protein
MVASLAEELRTPMMPTARYTDRLLGESPAVLGDSSRQQFPRVEANRAPMDGPVNDRIRVTHFDPGQIEPAPEPIDLVAREDLGAAPDRLVGASGE